MHDFYLASIHLVNDTACGTAIGNILRSICLMGIKLGNLKLFPFLGTSAYKKSWSGWIITCWKQFQTLHNFLNGRIFRRMKSVYIKKAKQIMHSVLEILIPKQEESLYSVPVTERMSMIKSTSSAYSNVESWGAQRQILSLLVQDYRYSTVVWKYLSLRWIVIIILLLP